MRVNLLFFVFIASFSNAFAQIYSVGNDDGFSVSGYTQADNQGLAIYSVGNDDGFSGATYLGALTLPVTVNGATGANGAYATLKAAFDAINANATQTGNNIVITLTANTLETATAVLNNNATWTSVKIYPTTTGLSISGNLASPLIDLNGADNVTIDGRVNATGSTKDLIITNTSTSATAGTSTIRLYNGALTNTIQYCTVKGSSMDAAAGIIFLSDTAANTGNTITNNNITNSLDANRPLNTIYSAGAANTVTISNNNIYDFLNRATASCGVNLNTSTAASTISGNSFYETTNFTPTANVAYYPVYVATTAAVAIGITGNYIGGNAASGGGTWTKAAGQSNIFTAINLAGNGPTYTVQSNQIKNITWNNTGNASLTGIYAADKAAIGASTLGNTISTITLNNTASGGTFTGISLAGATASSSNYNTVTAITCANTGGTAATNFVGIANANTATGTTISNNTIGHTSTANSINASSTSTGNAQTVIGINNTGASAGLTISSNIIANMTNATTNTTVATAGYVSGIMNTANATVTMNSNTIHDLTIANANTAADHTASVTGIALSNASASLSTGTNNTVYNLSNSYASFAGSIYGIYFYGGSGANDCSGNTIYNLSATGASAGAARLIGLNFNAGTGANAVNKNFIYGFAAANSTSASFYGMVKATGAVTIANNIINLGTTAPATIYGIMETGASGETTNLYFNTVYIGGTASSGALPSYALYSAVNTNTRNFRNNLFTNFRTGGTGTHYSPYVVSTGETYTFDYNDYYVAGATLGYFGADIADIAAWQAATAQDAGSLSVNPSFTNAGSTTATDYKLNTYLPGVNGTGITTDYAGTSRYTTPTMGAWEKAVNRWKGSISTDWNTASNWTLGIVPIEDAPLIFDDVPLNNCLLDADHSVTNITNASAYNLVANGHKLTIKGSINQSSTGKIDASTSSSTVEFAGGAAQSIPSGAFYNNDVFNLTVNNAANVALSGTLNLMNTLTATSGRLDAYTNTPTFVYAGTSAQSIGNQFLLDKATNLTINNAAGVTVNSAFTVDNSLTINNAKLLSIAEQKQLNVLGTITNNAGTSGLVIMSSASGTGSLINYTDNVPATVNRYIDGIDGIAAAWHFLSAPVSNQTISGTWKPGGTYGDGTGYDLYVWDEPNSCWIYNLNTTVAPTWATVHPSASFVAGRGYLYAVQAATPTKQFVGNLNNGTINYALTKDATGINNGFNLIGNPYPSSIDWKMDGGFTRGMLLLSGTGYDIWTWSTTANNYGVYNSADAGDIGTNNVSRYIAPMQGFFVRANTAGTFSFNNLARVHTGASDWMKVMNKNAIQKVVRVMVQSLDGKGSDEVRINFGYDANENGAQKMFSSVNTAPNLFLPTANQLCSVRYLTDTLQNHETELNFKAGIAGNYMLECSTDLLTTGTIYLEDKLTKTIQDMSISNQYMFSATPADMVSRFILHYGLSKISTTTANFEAKIYSANSSVIIDLSGMSGDYEVRLTDISGQQLGIVNIKGGQKQLFESLPGSVYFVNIRSAAAVKAYKVVCVK
jgi:hypothetical protein